MEVYCIYDGFANLVVSPRFKRFPPSMKVLPYPFYNAGWRFFDLRRYGRDHRKILVVDDAVGFVGGYNIGTAYATEWRDTHIRLTGPAVWDLKRAFADFWNLHRRRLIGPSERPLLLETAAVVGAAGPGAPQRAAAVDVPDPRACTSRRSTAPAATSGSPRPTSCPTRTSSTRWWPRRSAGSTSGCWCR